MTSPIPISINLSASNLKSPSLLRNRLMRWLDQGIAPDHVKLEITENAVSGRGLVFIEKTLHQLAGLGFSFSMDDFGTGEGSFIHLRHLPISEIKIDRCFVQSLLTSDLDRAIVMSSLTLSEALGYSCIAEGIETLAQARALQALGVRTGQGYLWAAPMPLEQFLAFVRRANAPGIAA